VFIVRASAPLALFTFAAQSSTSISPDFDCAVAGQMVRGPVGLFGSPTYRTVFRPNSHRFRG
jgi:hypothetical protein